MNNLALNYRDKLIETLENLDISNIVLITELLQTTRGNDGTIYICGNGGSAATATHFACDLMLKGFKAISLTSNESAFSACANDYGYSDSFSRQLEQLLESGDIVIGISGSGNSANVLKAMTTARRVGNMTVGITGFSGGALAKVVDWNIHVNVDDMQIAEDVHLIISHIITRLVGTIG